MWYELCFSKQRPVPYISSTFSCVFLCTVHAVTGGTGGLVTAPYSPYMYMSYICRMYGYRGYRTLLARNPCYRYRGGNQGTTEAWFPNPGTGLDTGSLKKTTPSPVREAPYRRARLRAFFF